jgi:NADH-quinone oxidoreductase subunit C
MADESRKPPEPSEPASSAAASTPEGGTPSDPPQAPASTPAPETAAAPTAPKPSAPPPKAPVAGGGAAPKAAPAAGAAAPKPAAEHPPKAAAPTGPPDQAPPADMTPPGYIAALQSALPGAVSQVSYWVGDWTLIVPAERVLEVARRLRESPDASFDFCSDLTASDWPSRAERFDVVYCLYSTRHRQRVRVKTKVAEHEPLASVTPVWPSANWLEREVYDLFGVNFTGHPDRRRILMPDDWQGHPQRKDYPLEGPGELLMENPLDWLKLRQAREEADIE